MYFQSIRSVHKIWAVHHEQYEIFSLIHNLCGSTLCGITYCKLFRCDKINITQNFCIFENCHSEWRLNIIIVFADYHFRMFCATLDSMRPSCVSMLALLTTRWEISVAPALQMLRFCYCLSLWFSAFIAFHSLTLMILDVFSIWLRKQ